MSEFDKYHLRAQFGFEVEGNSFATMSTVQGQLKGLVSLVGKLETSASRSGNFMGTLSKGMGASVSSFKNARGAMDGTSKSASKAQNQLKELADEFKTISAEAKSVQFGGFAKSGPSAYIKGAKSLKDYANQLDRVQSKIKGNTHQERILSAQIKQQSTAIKDRIEIYKLQRKALAEAEKKGFFDAVGKVSGEVFNKSKDVGKDFVNIYADFDDKMAAVGAVSRASAEDMELLRKKAKELGASTRFTGGQAAEAERMLAAAGFRAKDILVGVGDALSLASAGQIDLGTSADIASNVLSGLGLKVEQLGHVTDVMALAAASANTNISQLGTAMSYAGPPAKLFGAKIEEVSAMIGVMSDSGIQADKAGTALRSTFLRLASPPSEAAAALQEYNIAVADSETGKLRNIVDVLEEMSTKFKLDPKAMAQFSTFMADVEEKGGDLDSALENLPDGLHNQQKAIKALNSIFGKTAISGASAAIAGLDKIKWMSLSGAASSVEFEKALSSGLIPATAEFQQAMQNAKTNKTNFFEEFVQLVPDFKTANKEINNAVAQITRQDFGIKINRQKANELANYFQSVNEFKDVDFKNIKGGEDLFDRLISSTDDAQVSLSLMRTGMQKFGIILPHQTGAAQKMAETMEDNLAGSFRSLGSALEAIKLSLIEPLAPIIRAVAEALTKVSLIVANLPGPIRTVIALIGATTFSLGALGLALSLIMKMLSGFGQAQASVAIASRTMQSDLLQFHALPAAFNEMAGTNPFTNTFSKNIKQGFGLLYTTKVGPLLKIATSFTALKVAFAGIIKQNIAPVFNEIAFAVSRASVGVRLFATSPLGLLISGLAILIFTLEAATPQISIIGKTLGTLAAPFAFLGGIISGFAKGIASELGGLASITSKIVTGPIGMVGKAVAVLMDDISQYFKSGEEIGENFAKAMFTPIRVVTTKILDLWQAMLLKIGGLLNVFATIAGTIGARLPGMLAENSPGPTYQIREAWENTVGKIKGWILGLAVPAQWLQGKLVQLLNHDTTGTIGNAWTHLKEHIFEALGSIASFAGTIGGNIMAALASPFTTGNVWINLIMSTFTSPFTSLIKRFEDWAGEMLSPITSRFENVKDFTKPLRDELGLLAKASVFSVKGTEDFKFHEQFKQKKDLYESLSPKTLEAIRGGSAKAYNDKTGASFDAMEIAVFEAFYDQNLQEFNTIDKKLTEQREAAKEARIEILKQIVGVFSSGKDTLLNLFRFHQSIFKEIADRMDVFGFTALTLGSLFLNLNRLVLDSARELGSMIERGGEFASEAYRIMKGTNAETQFTSVERYVVGLFSTSGLRAVTGMIPGLIAIAISSGAFHWMETQIVKVLGFVQQGMLNLGERIKGWKGYLSETMDMDEVPLLGQMLDWGIVATKSLAWVAGYLMDIGAVADDMSSSIGNFMKTIADISVFEVFGKAIKVGDITSFISTMFVMPPFWKGLISLLSRATVVSEPLLQVFHLFTSALNAIAASIRFVIAMPFLPFLAAVATKISHVGETATGIGTFVSQKAGRAFEKVAHAAEGTAEKVFPQVHTLFDQIADMVDRGAVKISKYFYKLTGWLRTLGPLGQKIADKLERFLPKIGQSIQKFITKSLTGWMKKVFSKETFAIIGAFGQNLGTMFVKALPIEAVKGFFSQLGKLVNVFGKTFAKAIPEFGAAFNIPKAMRDMGKFKAEFMKSGGFAKVLKPRFTPFDVSNVFSGSGRQELAERFTAKTGMRTGMMANATKELLEQIPIIGKYSTTMATLTQRFAAFTGVGSVLLEILGAVGFQVLEMYLIFKPLNEEVMASIANFEVFGYNVGQYIVPFLKWGRFIHVDLVEALGRAVVALAQFTVYAVKAANWVGKAIGSVIDGISTLIGWAARVAKFFFFLGFLFYPFLQLEIFGVKIFGVILSLKALAGALWLVRAGLQEILKFSQEFALAYSTGTLGQFYVRIIKGGVKSLKEGIGGALNKIGTAFVSAGRKILNVFVEIASVIGQIAKLIFLGIPMAIVSLGKKIWRFIHAPVKETQETVEWFETTTKKAVYSIPVYGDMIRENDERAAQRKESESQMPGGYMPQWDDPGTRPKPFDLGDFMRDSTLATINWLTGAIDYLNGLAAELFSWLTKPVLFFGMDADGWKMVGKIILGFMGLFILGLFVVKTLLTGKISKGLTETLKTLVGMANVFDKAKVNARKFYKQNEMGLKVAGSSTIHNLRQSKLASPIVGYGSDAKGKSESALREQQLNINKSMVKLQGELRKIVVQEEGRRTKELVQIMKHGTDAQREHYQKFFVAGKKNFLGMEKYVLSLEGQREVGAKVANELRNAGREVSPSNDPLTKNAFSLTGKGDRLAKALEQAGVNAAFGGNLSNDDLGKIAATFSETDSMRLFSKIQDTIASTDMNELVNQSIQEQFVGKAVFENAVIPALAELNALFAKDKTQGLGRHPGDDNGAIAGLRNIIGLNKGNLPGHFAIAPSTAAQISAQKANNVDEAWVNQELLKKALSSVDESAIALKDMKYLEIKRLREAVAPIAGNPFTPQNKADDLASELSNPSSAVPGVKYLLAIYKQIMEFQIAQKGMDFQPSKSSKLLPDAYNRITEGISLYSPLTLLKGIGQEGNSGREGYLDDILGPSSAQVGMNELVPGGFLNLEEIKASLNPTNWTTDEIDTKAATFKQKVAEATAKIVEAQYRYLMSISEIPKPNLDAASLEQAMEAETDQASGELASLLKGSKKGFGNLLEFLFGGTIGKLVGNFKEAQETEITKRRKEILMQVAKEVGMTRQSSKGGSEIDMEGLAIQIGASPDVTPKLLQSVIQGEAVKKGRERTFTRGSGVRGINRAIQEEYLSPELLGQAPGTQIPLLDKGIEEIVLRALGTLNKSDFATVIEELLMPGSSFPGAEALARAVPNAYEMETDRDGITQHLYDGLPLSDALWNLRAEISDPKLAGMTPQGGITASLAGSVGNAFSNKNERQSFMDSTNTQAFIQKASGEGMSAGSIQELLTNRNDSSLDEMRKMLLAKNSNDEKNYLTASIREQDEILEKEAATLFQAKEKKLAERFKVWAAQAGVMRSPETVIQELAAQYRSDILKLVSNNLDLTSVSATFRRSIETVYGGEKELRAKFQQDLGSKDAFKNLMTLKDTGGEGDDPIRREEKREGARNGIVDVMTKWLAASGAIPKLNTAGPDNPFSGIAQQMSVQARKQNETLYNAMMAAYEEDDIDPTSIGSLAQSIGSASRAVDPLQFLDPNISDRSIKSVKQSRVQALSAATGKENLYDIASNIGVSPGAVEKFISGQFNSLAKMGTEQHQIMEALSFGFEQIQAQESRSGEDLFSGASITSRYNRLSKATGKDNVEDIAKALQVSLQSVERFIEGDLHTFSLMTEDRSKVLKALQYKVKGIEEFHSENILNQQKGIKGLMAEGLHRMIEAPMELIGLSTLIENRKFSKRLRQRLSGYRALQVAEAKKAATEKIAMENDSRKRAIGLEKALILAPKNRKRRKASGADDIDSAARNQLMTFMHQAGLSPAELDQLRKSSEPEEVNSKVDLKGFFSRHSGTEDVLKGFIKTGKLERHLDKSTLERIKGTIGGKFNPAELQASLGEALPNEDLLKSAYLKYANESLRKPGKSFQFSTADLSEDEIASIDQLIAKPDTTEEELMKGLAPALVKGGMVPAGASSFGGYLTEFLASKAVDRQAKSRESKNLAPMNSKQIDQVMKSVRLAQEEQVAGLLLVEQMYQQRKDDYNKILLAHGGDMDAARAAIFKSGGSDDEILEKVSDFDVLRKYVTDYEKAAEGSVFATLKEAKKSISSRTGKLFKSSVNIDSLGEQLQGDADSVADLIAGANKNTLQVGKDSIITPFEETAGFKTLIASLGLSEKEFMDIANIQGGKLEEMQISVIMFFRQTSAQFQAFRDNIEKNHKVIAFITKPLFGAFDMMSAGLTKVATGVGVAFNKGKEATEKIPGVKQFQRASAKYKENQNYSLAGIMQSGGIDSIDEFEIRLTEQMSKLLPTMRPDQGDQMLKNILEGKDVFGDIERIFEPNLKGKNKKERAEQINYIEQQFTRSFAQATNMVEEEIKVLFAKDKEGKIKFNVKPIQSFASFFVKEVAKDSINSLKWFASNLPVVHEFRQVKRDLAKLVEDTKDLPFLERALKVSLKGFVTGLKFLVKSAISPITSFFRFADALTFGHFTKALQAVGSDMIRGFGKPVLEAAYKNIAKFKRTVSKAGEGFKKIFPKTGMALEKAIFKQTDSVQDYLSKQVAEIDKYGSWTGKILEKINVPKVISFAKKALGMAAKGIAIGLGAVGAVSVGAVTGVMTAMIQGVAIIEENGLQGFVTIGKNLFAPIAHGLLSINNKLQDWGNAIHDFLAPIPDSVMKFAAKLEQNTLEQNLQLALGGIKNALAGVAGTIGGLFMGAVNFIKNPSGFIKETKSAIEKTAQYPKESWITQTGSQPPEEEIRARAQGIYHRKLTENNLPLGATLDSDQIWSEAIAELNSQAEEIRQEIASIPASIQLMLSVRDAFKSTRSSATDMLRNVSQNLKTGLQWAVNGINSIILDPIGSIGRLFKRTKPPASSIQNIPEQPPTASPLIPDASTPDAAEVASATRMGTFDAPDGGVSTDQGNFFQKLMRGKMSQRKEMPPGKMALMPRLVAELGGSLKEFGKSVIEPAKTEKYSVRGLTKQSMPAELPVMKTVSPEAHADDPYSTYDYNNPNDSRHASPINPGTPWAYNVSDVIKTTVPLFERFRHTAESMAKKTALRMAGDLAIAAEQSGGKWGKFTQIVGVRFWGLAKDAWKAGQKILSGIADNSPGPSAEAPKKWDHASGEISGSMVQMADAAGVAGSQIGDSLTQPIQEVKQSDLAAAKQTRKSGFFATIFKTSAIASKGILGVTKLSAGSVRMLGGGLMGTAAAMGGLSSVFQNTNPEIARMLEKFSQLSMVLGAVGAFVNAPVLAFLALGAAAFGLYKAFEVNAFGIREKVAAMGSFISGGLTFIKNVIVGSLQTIQNVLGFFGINIPFFDTLVSFIDNIGLHFQGAIDWITGAWQGFVDKFWGLLYPIVQPAIQIGNMLIGALNCNPTERIPEAWEGAMDRVSNSFNWLVAPAQAIGNKISGIFSKSSDGAKPKKKGGFFAGLFKLFSFKKEPPVLPVLLDFTQQMASAIAMADKAGDMASSNALRSLDTVMTAAQYAAALQAEGGNYLGRAVGDTNGREGMKSHALQALSGGDASEFIEDLKYSDIGLFAQKVARDFQAMRTNAGEALKEVQVEFKDRFDYLKRFGTTRLSGLFKPGTEILSGQVKLLGESFNHFGKEAFQAIATLDFKRLSAAAKVFGEDAWFAIGRIIEGFKQMSISAIALGIYTLTGLSPVALIMLGIAAAGFLVMVNFLGIRTMLSGLIKVFAGLGEAAFSVVVMIAKAFGGLKRIVGGVKLALSGDFSEMKLGWQQFKDAIAAGAKGVGAGLRKALGGVGEILQGAFQGLRQILFPVEFILKKVFGLAVALVSPFDRVVQAATNIKSALTLTREEGRKLGETLATGLISFFKAIPATLSRGMEWVRSNAGTLFKVLYDEILGTLADAIKLKAIALIATLTSKDFWSQFDPSHLVDSFVEGFKQLPAMLSDIFGRVMQGDWMAMLDIRKIFVPAIESVQGYLDNLITNLHGMLPSFDGIREAISQWLHPLSGVLGIFEGFGSRILQEVSPFLDIVTHQLTGIGDTVKEHISGVFDRLPDVISRVMTHVSPILDTITHKLSGIGQVVKENLFGVFERLPDIFSNVMTQISPILDNIAHHLSGIGHVAIDQILQAWLQFVGNFGHILTPIVDFATRIAQHLISALNCNPTERIPEAWREAIEKISGMFGMLVQPAVDVAQKLVAALSFNTKNNTALEGVFSLATQISEFTTALRTELLGELAPLLERFSGMLSENSQKIGGVFGEALKELASRTAVAVQGINGLVERFQALPISAGGAAKAGRSVGKAIATAVYAITELVQKSGELGHKALPYIQRFGAGAVEAGLAFAKFGGSVLSATPELIVSLLKVAGALKDIVLNVGIFAKDFVVASAKIAQSTAELVIGFGKFGITTTESIVETTLAFGRMLGAIAQIGVDAVKAFMGVKNSIIELTVATSSFVTEGVAAFAKLLSEAISVAGRVGEVFKNALFGLFGGGLSFGESFSGLKAGLGVELESVRGSFAEFTGTFETGFTRIREAASGLQVQFSKIREAWNSFGAEVGSFGMMSAESFNKALTSGLEFGNRIITSAKEIGSNVITLGANFREMTEGVLGAVGRGVGGFAEFGQAIFKVSAAVIQLIMDIGRLGTEAFVTLEKLSSYVTSRAQQDMEKTGAAFKGIANGIKNIVGLGGRGQSDEVVAEVKNATNQIQANVAQTTGYVAQELKGLSPVAQTVGQQMVANLTEASPGPTWQIRKNWDKTSVFMYKAMREGVFDSENAGKAIALNYRDSFAEASKAADFAQGNILSSFEKIRQAAQKTKNEKLSILYGMGQQELANGGSVDRIHKILAEAQKVAVQTKNRDLAQSTELGIRSNFVKQRAMRDLQPKGPLKAPDPTDTIAALKSVGTPVPAVKESNKQIDPIKQIKQISTATKDPVKEIKRIPPAAQAANRMMMTLGGTLSNFAPNLASPMFMVGDFFDLFETGQESIAEFAKSGVTVGGVLGKFSSSIGTAATGFGGFVTAVFTGGVSLSGVFAAISVKAGVMWAALSGPLLPLALVVGAIAGMFLIWKFNIFGIGDAVGSVFRGIGNFFGELFRIGSLIVNSVFVTLRYELRLVFHAIGRVFEGIINTFRPVAQFFNWLKWSIFGMEYGVTRVGRRSEMVLINLILLPLKAVADTLKSIIRFVGQTVRALIYVTTPLIQLAVISSAIVAAVTLGAVAIAGITTVLGGVAGVLSAIPAALALIGAIGLPVLIGLGAAFAPIVVGIALVAGLGLALRVIFAVITKTFEFLGKAIAVVIQAIKSMLQIAGKLIAYVVVPFVQLAATLGAIAAAVMFGGAILAQVGMIAGGIVGMLAAGLSSIPAIIGVIGVIGATVAGGLAAAFGVVAAVVAPVLIGLATAFAPIAAGIAVIFALAFVLRGVFTFLGKVIHGVMTVISEQMSRVGGVLFTELGGIWAEFTQIGAALWKPFAILFEAIGSVLSAFGVVKGEGSLMGTIVGAAVWAISIPIKMTAEVLILALKIVGFIIKAVIFLGRVLVETVVAPFVLMANIIKFILGGVKNFIGAIGGLFGGVGGFFSNIFSSKEGGKQKQPGYATGGWVAGTGTSTSDSISALLSRDEFVVNAAAARKYPQLLELINEEEFNPGMLLQPVAVPAVPTGYTPAAPTKSEATPTIMQPVFNFSFSGDIVLKGATGPDAANEFFESLAPSLNRKVREILRDMVDKMK